VEVFSKEFDGAQDLAAAFDDIKSAGARAPIFNTDNQISGRRKEIAVLALSHRLPSIHSFSPEVEDGGFMSYGPDLSESYRRAAALADRILKGSSPADLPVEEPTQFSLGINLATAKALGVMIPPMLLARADLVVE
jgi:putative ABC transport system substrate-binding protein